MPMLDMPLEKLQTYTGTNPRPADFDAFWDGGLAEMRATDPCVVLQPSAFQTPYAECFDLYFTGVGGARVHAKYLRPTNAPSPHPAVLKFHGYSGNAGEWHHHLQFAQKLPLFGDFVDLLRGQTMQQERFALRFQ